VESVTGVDNVCERSAIAAGGDRLIFPKHIYDGVTVAIAEKMPDVNDIYRQLKEYDAVYFCNSIENCVPKDAINNKIHDR
jgi:hypothetical protein